MKTVGIVGGVGPEASNKFCEILIKRTHAKNDQENLPFLHFCNPQIPDRTDYLLGNGEDPTPEMIKTSKKLEKAGADFLVIPCNTAHSFLPKIQEGVSIPIVDMTKILVKGVLSDYPPIEKIGILATTGSIRTRIYQDYFESVGIETLTPTEEEQENLVMEAIYGNKGIKAGKKLIPRKKLREAAKKLISRGAEAIVLGCTEIPLVLKQKDFTTKLYDPMDLTTKEIVKYISEDLENEVVSVRFVLRDFAKSVGRTTLEVGGDINVGVAV